MAWHALKVSDRLPVGTSVSAYPARQFVTTKPSGSAVDTRSVAGDGSLTFIDLVEDTDYVAYAQVDGRDVIVRFRTRPPLDPYSLRVNNAANLADYAGDVIGGNWLTVIQDLYDSGRPIYAPEGTYDWTGEMAPRDWAPVLIGDGKDRTIFRQQSAAPLFSNYRDGSGAFYPARESLSTVTTADVSAGATTVQFATAGYAANDYILIKSNKTWLGSSGASKYGEILRIKTVDSSSQVSLWGQVDEEYLLANAPTIKKLAMIRGGLFRDFTVENPNRGTLSSTSWGIFLNYFERPVVENVGFIGMDAASVGFRMSVAHKAAFLDFYNSSDDALDIDDDPEPDVKLRGYGVYVGGGSRQGISVGLSMDMGRHCWTCGASSGDPIPRHQLVASSKATRMNQSCFDTHPTGRFIDMVDLEANASINRGLKIRAADVTVINFRTYGVTNGIYVDPAAVRAKIRGADIGRTSTSFGLFLDGPCDVADVDIADTFSAGVTVTNTAAGTSLRRVRCARTEYGGTAGTKRAFSVSAQCELVDCYAEDVDIVASYGNAITGLVERGLTAKNYTSLRTVGTGSTFSEFEGTGVGVPALDAPKGSVYRRTDGGTGSTLYVKETANGSTVWSAWTTGGGGAADIDTTAKTANTGLFYDRASTKYLPGPALKEIVAQMDSTQTGGYNAAAIQTAINTAVALGAESGSKIKVTAAPGTYLADYPQHALLASPFVAGTNSTIVLNDARDFPSSGTIKITDPFWCQLQEGKPEATCAYTGKTSTTLTGVTVSVGSGNTYAVGCGVNVSGVGETREIISTTGGNFELDMYGVTLDMSNAVMVQPGDSKGAILFQFGQPTQPAAPRYTRGSIWPAQQWACVGSAVQANGAFTGPYAGEFATWDWVLVQADGVNDYDPARVNPPGEVTRIADPVEFGTYVKTTLAAGALTASVQPCLSNRAILDPNQSATTLSGALALNGSETSVAVTSAAALGYREPLNSRFYASRTGLLYLTDGGANEEFIFYEGVDYETNTLLNLQRGLLGTSKPAWSGGGTQTVKMVALAKIESEVVAYEKYDFNTVLTLTKRGVNGTTDATHTVVTSPAYQPIIHTVPLPGYVFFRNGLQHDRVYEPGRQTRPPTTKLAAGLGDNTTWTEGTQITVQCDDLTDFDASGLFTIGTEVCSYTHRDAGRFYNVTRGLHGTLISTRTVGNTVTQVAATPMLTDPISSSVTALPINGWPGYAPMGAGNFVRIDDELINLKSGTSSSGTTNGYIFQSTTLNGALGTINTTITLASVTGWTDPVAKGIALAYGIVDNEIFSYTAISGSSLTGVKRGYRSKAATHADGATVKHYKSLNAVSTGRHAGGTTAASHSAGALAGQSEPPFVQKLALAQRIDVHGVKVYAASSRAIYPRAQSAGGPGANTVMNRKTAFKLHYTQNVNFHDVTIDGTERDGISQEPAIDTKITSCTFENVAGQGWGYSIDHLGACQDINIIGNTFRHCRHGCCVSAAGGKPGQPRRINFIGNHVADTINAAWESQAAAVDVLVEGNTFISSHAPGCLINNPRTRIKNNTFRTMGGYAIQLGNLSRSAGQFEIAGNLFENCDLGVFIFVDDTSPNAGLTTYKVTDNEFVNCRTQCLLITNKATDAQAGHKVTGVVVSGNKVRGATVVNSSAGNAARFSLNYLSGALVFGNSFAHVAGSQEGIYATNMDSSVINANVVHYRSPAQSAGASRAGIIIVSGDSNIVSSNRVIGCTNAAPIDVTGATNTTQSANLTTP